MYNTLCLGYEMKWPRSLCVLKCSHWSRALVGFRSSVGMRFDLICRMDMKGNLVDCRPPLVSMGKDNALKDSSKIL